MRSSGSAGRLAEQGLHRFQHAGALRGRLVGGLQAGGGAQGGDFVQQAAQREREPRALGAAGGHQGRQRGGEALAEGGLAGAGGGVVLGGGGRAQHARQRQQGLRAGRGRAGNAGGEVGRQRQHLLQRGRIGGEARLVVALDREVGGDVAALELGGGGLAQGGLQRVEPGRQAEAQFQAAAVDAAQLPGPGESVGDPLGAGESGHRGQVGRGNRGGRGGHGCKSFKTRDVLAAPE